MRVFFTQSATVERLTDTPAQDKESYVVQSGTIKCFLLPIGAEDVMLSEGNPSQSFKMFCDKDANVRETDRVTVNSETYIVKGMRRYIMGLLGAVEYKELMLEKLNS